MTRLAVKIDTPAIAQDLIIGNSAPIIRLRDMIARVAGSSASVMISGPSGSGKELVARAIHNASTRHKDAFVALNCGAIPGELIESELFGHERGAFTGAHTRRIGRFEEAHRGTLFLDEIGDMRFDMQVKLLRVLEDQIVTRIGGTAALPVDVRIISATHQDVDQAMADGRFREDLFFRLGVVLLHVPDLASRVDDIPLLIEHFQKNRPRALSVRFDASAITRLMNHSWPGNIRELRNVVERANVLFGGETLSAHDVEHLLGNAQIQAVRAKVPVPPSGASIPVPLKVVSNSDQPINLKDMIETMELERITIALGMADGVISEAARLLTLKRTTLIEKMRKYGVAGRC